MRGRLLRGVAFEEGGEAEVVWSSERPWRECRGRGKLFAASWGQGGGRCKRGHHAEGGGEEGEFGEGHDGLIRSWRDRLVFRCE